MSKMTSMPLPEVLQFLQQFPLKYAAIAAIGVTTGSRITEILSLRRFDLLEPDGTPKKEVRFIRQKSECGARRGIPQEIRRLLKQKELKLDEQTIREFIRLLKEDAGQKRRRRPGKEEKYCFRSIPAGVWPVILRYLQAEEERGCDRPDDWVFRGQRGEHLSRLTVYHEFRKRLGSGYGTHWMRKTFASEYYADKLSENPDAERAVELTRRALNHRRTETTKRYLGFEERSIEETKKRIFENFKL